MVKRDFRFFDQWARRNGMMPIARVTNVEVNGTPIGDVLLADSEQMIAGSEFPPMEGQQHGMLYFYRTGFAIDRPGDKTWFASFNDYPPMNFLEYGSPEARKQQRLNEALTYAREMMSQTHEAGLYGGPAHRTAAH
jgi:hypothetical protein